MVARHRVARIRASVRMRHDHAHWGCDVKIRSRLVALAGRPCCCSAARSRRRMVPAARPSMASDSRSTTSLGRSVNILTVPAQPPDSQQLEVPDAPHLAFVPYGRRHESAKVPRRDRCAGRGPRLSRRRPARYELAAQSADQLRTLADRSSRPRHVHGHRRRTASGTSCRTCRCSARVRRSGHVRSTWIPRSCRGSRTSRHSARTCRRSTAGDFWYTVPGPQRGRHVVCSVSLGPGSEHGSRSDRVGAQTRGEPSGANRRAAYAQRREPCTPP